MMILSSFVIEDFLCDNAITLVSISLLLVACYIVNGCDKQDGSNANFAPLHLDASQSGQSMGVSFIVVVVVVAVFVSQKGPHEYHGGNHHQEHEHEQKRYQNGPQVA